VAPQYGARTGAEPHALLLDVRCVTILSLTNSGECGRVGCCPFDQNAKMILACYQAAHVQAYDCTNMLHALKS
jgi:hypothetical protein